MVIALNQPPRRASFRILRVASPCPRVALWTYIGLAAELGLNACLAGVGAGEPKEILAAFQAFEATGGMILKDRLCHTALPGRDLGLAYDEKQLHNGWGPDAMRRVDLSADRICEVGQLR